MMIYRFIFLVALVFSWSIFAKKTKIAVLYTKATAKEYVCMTNAFEKKINKVDTKLELNQYDYQDNLITLIRMAKDIVRNNYDAVIGPRTSQEAIAIAKILNKSEIPFILPGASSSIIRKLNQSSIFISPDSDSLSRASSKMIIRQFKAKSILILINLSLPYSTELGEKLKEELIRLKYQGNVVEHRYIEGFQEKEKFIKLTEKYSIDFIYAPIYGVDISLFFNELAKQKRALTFFTHAGIFEIKELLKRPVVGPKLTLIFNGIWDQKERGLYRGEYNELIRNYCPEMKTSTRAILAYDAIKLFYSVKKRYPSLKGRELVKKVKNTVFEGVLDTRRPKNGRATVPMPVYEHTRNGIHLLGKFNDE